MAQYIRDLRKRAIKRGMDCTVLLRQERGEGRESFRARVRRIQENKAIFASESVSLLDIVKEIAQTQPVPTATRYHEVQAVQAVHAPQAGEGGSGKEGKGKGR
jgi:hypothetical protein